MDIEYLYDQYLNSSGISKDTRSLKPNQIYFGIRGQNFDGNKFALQALEKGARMVVLDHVPSQLNGDNRVFRTSDAILTLQQLASYHRLKLKCAVIAVTGSNGKTTTKELLYSILSNFESSTFATQGNLNNHIGVPLTILSVPSGARFAIVEMGSNQPGDIAQLCQICQPNYGLITNIGAAHLEKLGSRQGVFNEKTALYQYLKINNGKFFKNESDDLLIQITSDLTIGYSSTCSLFSQIEHLNKSNPLKIKVSNAISVDFIETHLFGNYNLENISAAITVAEYFDIPYKFTIDGIARYRPVNMRSQLLQTQDNELILDAYNSNPNSLNSILSEFTQSQRENKVAIIGDMLELGDHSHDEHFKILNYCAARDGIDFYFIGSCFHFFKDDFDFRFFRDTDEGFQYLKSQKIEGAFILLKASRGIGLEKLLDAL